MAERLETAATDAATTDTTTPAATTEAAVSTSTTTIADTSDAAVAATDKTATTTDAPNWRVRMAGEDKSFLKTLDKYSDEAAFANAHKALLQKMSSGELKPADTPFPEKGTDVEKAAWLKAKGVPEKPELYIESVKLPNGIVPGEADKPGLDRLAKLASDRKWSQERYNEVLEAYYQEAEAAANAREDQDAQFKQQSEDALRGDWDKDYRRNLGAVRNLLEGAPAGVKERLLGGRTSDGRLIGDDPTVLKWLAQTALDINPAASVLPTGQGTPTGVESRLKEIREIRRNDPNKYDADKALQAEELQLIEADTKIKGRAA